METGEIQPWWFLVEPYKGESISHFLGRFRRANELSVSGLGKISGLGEAIARWEKFRFNPPPSLEQLEALAKVVVVETEQLVQMLAPPGVGMKLSPIRLCAACYGEVPCHRIEWQLKRTDCCEKHSLRLLSECFNCKARFQIPALWVDGWCLRCFLSSAEMAKAQKVVV